MKKIAFSQSEFVGSTLSCESLPHLKSLGGSPLPEIAVVGKSNVGKSSLINHLLKRKSLARVSGKPGKTQTLNFFVIDNEVALVDLPGYGYAQATSTLKKQWSETIGHYLKNRKSIKLILFLMDCRRDPTEEDCAFLQWASHYQLPLLTIFTKADKLSEHEKQLNAANCLNTIKSFLNQNLVQSLHYSIKDARSRNELIDHINTVLYPNGLKSRTSTGPKLRD